MPYAEFKAKHQTDASSAQQAAFAKSQAATATDPGR
jgi:hypothetical protein